MSINLVARLSTPPHEDEVLDVPLLILVSPPSYLRFSQKLWRDDSPWPGTIPSYCLSDIFDKPRRVICVLRMFLGFVQN